MYVKPVDKTDNTLHMHTAQVQFKINTSLPTKSDIAALQKFPLFV